MKHCSQCQQTFSDENFYCLSDGTPLIFNFDKSEETTVIRPSPFIQHPSQATRQGINPIFTYLTITVLALIVGGAIVFWIKSDSNMPLSAKNESANTVSNTTESKQNKEQDQISQQKANLQNEQMSLQMEKQKFADERKKLEVQKNKSSEQATFNQTNSKNYPTARIKFRRGSVEETISGSVSSERSFVLYTLSGQYLSASVSSGNNCVVFTNGSTNTSYTTNRGDSYLRLKNNCGGEASFNLTVYVG